MAAGITLIIGPHQAGKSRALWRRLRAEPPGAAVLVRPAPGLARELVAQAVAWDGPGLLPPALAWAGLIDRLAATVEAAPALLPPGVLRHRLRAWCATGLTGTPWAGLAGFRCAADGLAELLERLDDHRVGDEALAVAAAAARREDAGLAEALAAVVRARAWLRGEERRLGAATAGARLAALAAAAPALPWAALYLDDFLGFTPADAALIAALARDRRVVLTAVDDHRLGRGGAAERLRAAFPAAEVEALDGIHAEAPHHPPLRSALAALVGEEPLADPAALAWYHYRDEVHAGRALAAWLRMSGTPPAEAALFVRSADQRALALADALAAAGVPVAGRFSVPLAATAGGAALADLGRLLARPRWDRLLALLARLVLLGQAPAPAPLAGLLGPWAARPPAQAIAALRAGGEGVWRWEGDADALAALCDWLAERWDALAALTGTWAERLAAAVRRLDLGAEAAAVASALLALDALHAAGPDDLDELVAAQSVVVERTGGPGALVLHDALRGRAGVRRVAIVHGLEHGAWPRAARPSPLFTAERRAALARLLERDLYDEEGRAAGELAAFLAVAARGAERLVLGVPCGEREPCAWLAAILAQAGRELEAERAQAASEAVPGAPLAAADSQGPGEAALWVPAQPAPRAFRVPVRDPAALRLRPSDLNHLADDAFALLCDRLRLAHPLADTTASTRGRELHALVDDLAAQPVAAWTTALPALVAAWAAAAPDSFQRAARLRDGARLADTIARELAPGARSPWAPLAGAQVESERHLSVHLPLPDGGDLELSGRADRIDHLPDGRLRVVDWKTTVGNKEGYAEAIKEGREGQLAAYAAALTAEGHAVAAAGYVGLTDGKRAAWPADADWNAAMTRLGAAVARWSAGCAVASASGRTGRFYAAVARCGEWEEAEEEGAGAEVGGEVGAG